ncbi:MAG: hypothetical protein QOF78_2892 [Phycisphaerales bacterium]|jgi:rRNA maturation endonuclease Nob1|nr:hypothetical protein [Phycisphaerales bacterium]
MKMRIHQLVILCQGYHEAINFGDVSYFHGPMGAGKSTIARLVDFCLGGNLPMTPALHSEFLAAQLRLTVNGNALLIERGRAATTALAQWNAGKDRHEVIVPIRSPSGEVVPETGIEVLSDLFYHLAGMAPPKVRRSKLKEDSELGRLSLRDLLWYCYLDQESMDSDFFHLDSGADSFKRLKSRDVLRFLLGFHQERVSELEAELELLRTRRLRLEGGAEALKQALMSANLSSQMEIDGRLSEIKDRIDQLSRAIAGISEEAGQLVQHATEALRGRGRDLAKQLAETDDAVTSLVRVVQDDRRHLNELRILSTKFRRMASARAVLNNVEFETCPRCAKPLPVRPDESCRVCGQSDAIQPTESDQLDATDVDLTARSSEIDDAIKRRGDQLVVYRRRAEELATQKVQIDQQLDQASRSYDSAYLSRALAMEQERARLVGEAVQLERLRVLPQTVEDRLREAREIEAREAKVREDLKAARSAAERDAGNLRELERLFLDCLMRARVPGFNPTDVVQMRSPTFVPEVSAPEAKDMIITSFANLGSGGKKTLFKCCFALAIHRLAGKVGAALPTLLIIDSPMKNISERENREQFEGFHALVYELVLDELRGTQVVLIDKEYLAPPVGFELELVERRLSPEEPLLSGFKGTPPIDPDDHGTQKPAADAPSGGAAPSDDQRDRRSNSG